MHDCPGAVLTNGKWEVMCKGAGRSLPKMSFPLAPRVPCRVSSSHVCQVLSFLMCLIPPLSYLQSVFPGLASSKLLLLNPYPNICLERSQTKMQPFQLYHQFLMTVCAPPVANLQLLLPQTTSSPVPFRKSLNHANQPSANSVLTNSSWLFNAAENSSQLLSPLLEAVSSNYY